MTIKEVRILEVNILLDDYDSIAGATLKTFTVFEWEVMTNHLTIDIDVLIKLKAMIKKAWLEICDYNYHEQKMHKEARDMEEIIRDIIIMQKNLQEAN